MGVYNLDQIGDIIVNRPNKKRIAAAKKYNKKLMMHLHGKGVKESLKRLEYFENTDIYKSRVEYAMSNVDMFERLLREENQVFTARGGSQSFRLPEDKQLKMKEYVSNMVYDQSLRKWMSNFAINAYRADPMGLIVMEIEQAPSEGAENVEGGKPIDYGLQMPKCYPVYRSIQEVWEYKNVGQKLDYVCFLLTNDELIEYGIKTVSNDAPQFDMLGDYKKEEKYYRFIDDEKDVIVERVSGNRFVEAQLQGAPNPIPNPWKRCNAFVVSDILMFTDPQSTDTPLSKVVELADAYLKGRSVRDLQKAYHGFAKAVEPLLKCSSCGGDGIIHRNGSGEGVTKGRPCPECTPAGASRGTGYKLRTKVSDVAKFPIEMIADANFDYKKIFGYVTPDIDSWDKQDESIYTLERELYVTYYGVANAKIETNGSKTLERTATEVVADLAPKFARLNSTADWCENTENKIVEFLGEYYFPDEWGGSETAYSRDYIFQTPDTILKTYYDMKANGMTDSMLDDQYKKYIKALYQANPFLQDIYLKKFAVEPFPHLLASDVEKSTCVTEVDKLKKRYFGEWEETITDAMWLTKDRAVLDKMLTEYAQAKQTELPTQTEPNNNQ